MAKSCFLEWKKIEIRRSSWLSKVLARKKISRRELLNKPYWRRISYDLGEPSHLQENLNYNLSVVDKKQQIMLNNLSFTQEERRVCEEERIFQQDNAAIHNASITK